ncbi:BtrH N-terminal domain-containing protein [Myxococcota bacterium]|nr:BtrH N-terminal domain-containing protein [Myxococcota bacterium]
METMIDGYRIYPGEHCGSSSMRGLLEHYCGLKLPEDAVFGLAAGLDCGFFDSDAMDPPIGVFGRTASLEQDLGQHLQIDYREQTEDNDGQAWSQVREEVLAGRPTMLSGDILYLDYREYKVHFPGHRFVLLGFDDAIEKAFIADRIRDVPEACSYGALALSRNPPEGLSTHNLWGRFHGTEVGRDLVSAVRIAIESCAHRMLGQSADQAATEIPIPGDRKPAHGIAGIRAFTSSLPTWGQREDARWVASFNSRCIEKFGNGGGNFRRLYAGFLAWAHELDPQRVPHEASALATEAADGWTGISELLAQAARGEAAEDVWDQAARQAESVADIEETLFRRLAACGA